MTRHLFIHQNYAKPYDNLGVSRRQVGLVERRALAHEAQVNSQVDATLHLSIVLVFFSLSAARLSLCLGQVKVSNSLLGFPLPGCSCSAVFAQPRAAAAAAAAAARPVSYAKQRGMKGVKVLKNQGLVINSQNGQNHKFLKVAVSSGTS